MIIIIAATGAGRYSPKTVPKPQPKGCGSHSHNPKAVADAARRLYQSHSPKAVADTARRLYQSHSAKAVAATKTLPKPRRLYQSHSLKAVAAGWAWVMLQRGLVCIIETSFRNASQPMKHCFLQGTKGIFSRILAPSAAGSTKRRKYRQNCYAERWAVVLSVLLLLWLACVLRATPATKRRYLQCFVAFAFPGWLVGCSFWAACSEASGARASAM